MDKKKAVKRFLKIILVIFILFILINIVWFSWRAIKYNNYSKGMNKNLFYSAFVPKYLEDDKEGFSYSVKYPDYLSFTGNLSISMPIRSNNNYTDSLIIWPNLRNYEYGLILYDENNNEYMIEINENKEPKDSEYKEIINIHKENIDILFDKANEFWNLKLDKKSEDV